MKGNVILLESEPRGKFIEGVIYGTPKPGVCMQIKAAVEPIGGRHTWQVYQPGTDGEQRLVAVLLEDDDRGKTYDDAYVSGDRCFLYIPYAGDELNMRILDIAGTGTSGSEAKAIGDLLMINTGDGKLVDTTGSPEMESFQLLETQAEPISADALLHCMYTGH